MKKQVVPHQQLKRVFSAEELNTEPRVPEENLLNEEKIKDELRELRGEKIAKDIIVKKNKIINAKNIPSHLKTYVHSL